MLDKVVNITTVCAFIALALFAPISHSREPTWSFESKPLPDIENKTRKERRQELVLTRVLGSGTFREISPAMHLIYALRHPEFTDIEKRDADVLIFRQGLTQFGHTAAGQCLFSAFMHRIGELSDSMVDLEAPFAVCDIRQPQGGPEELAILLKIARDGIKAGNPLIANEYYEGFPMQSSIYLNADVAYFLKSQLAHLEVELDPTDVGITLMPERKLSAQRRSFINDAASRNDLDAVLATTKPCRRAW